MRDLTNKDRAEFALRAVQAFREVCKGTPNDVHEAIGDLLCNLAHLCDAEGISPHSIFEGALWTHADEVKEIEPALTGSLSQSPYRKWGIR
ncbi:MAG: hypothetical protein ABL901_02835 [Hyphomicrobiaceae bacterium]|nr:hypothetical protein [Hyphomicrobiaceae bacterium]